MNNSIISVLASDDVKGVSCVFTPFDHDDEDYESDPKEYTYKTLRTDLKVGDLVVVEGGGRDSRFGMGVVKVKRIDVSIDLSSNHTYKWVVDRINVEAYEEVLKAEKELVSKFRDAEMTHKKKSMREALGIAEVDTTAFKALTHRKD